MIYNNKLIRFWLLPHINTDAEHFRQVRLTVLVSLIAATTGLFYIPIQYFINPFGSIVSGIGTIQILFGLFLLRKGVSYQYIAHNLAFTYFWVLLAITLTTGGTDSSAIMQLSCIPLVAMILCGKKAGVMWVVVCFVEILSLSAFTHLGYNFPVWYNPKFRSMLNTTGQIGAVMTLFSLAWAFENSKTLAQEQTERLLLNTLPKQIADRLKRGEGTIVDNFNEVSVLFADIVGFTSLSSNLGPHRLVGLLNVIFSSLDLIADKYSLEKIKTIGDCYMLVGGLPEPNENHVRNIANAAIDIQKEFNRIQKVIGLPITVRIGIHIGPAVAGVIGKNKFAYDLWGDTVNTASRMESHGVEGRIHCTEAVYRALDQDCSFHERGEIEIKGIGKMRTYFLLTCPISELTLNPDVAKEDTISITNNAIIEDGTYN